MKHLLWSFVLVGWVSVLDGAIFVDDEIYGPQYRPLWRKGAKNHFTTKFGPSSIRHLVGGAGFGYENHTITTEDGYLINVNRIVHPEKSRMSNKGYPLLLLHGFMMQSDSWMVQNDMDDNLASVWSALGYDVWLGDYRGTLRSRGHVNLTADEDRKYWDFSVEETAVFDTSAFIDFILKHTGRQNLVVMCISLGCGQHAILISERPEYNEKIKGAFYFSPLVSNARPFLDMHLGYQLVFLNGEYFVESYETNGVYELAPRLTGVKKELFHLCNPFVDILLPVTKRLLNGGLNLPRTACYQTALSIGGSSSKTTRHVLQFYKSGEFAKFNYGREGNTKHYGQASTPLYDLSKVTSFVAVYYGDKDGSTSAKGIAKMLRSFSGPTYECQMAGFGHFDVGGGTAFKYVLPDVNEVLGSLVGRSVDTKKIWSKKCPSTEWIRHL